MPEPLDWTNEPFVRSYTRDTDDWILLSWEARALFHEVKRKVDRAGVLQTKRGARGVAVICRMPLGVVEVALAELVTEGWLLPIADGYHDPLHLDAEEANRSDKQRQRDSREKRSAKAKLDAISRASVPTLRLVSDPSTHTDDPGVTARDDEVESAGVSSHVVTPSFLPSSPSFLPLLPDLSSPVAPTLVSDDETGPSKRRRKEPKPSEVEGYAETVDAYFTAFEQATGSKPMMGAKQGAQIKRLIKQLGHASVIDRIRRLWAGELPWPPPPYDLDSLVRHIDKLAPQQTGARGRYEPETR